MQFQSTGGFNYDLVQKHPKTEFWRAKVDRGSSLIQQMCEKITGIFNIASQRNILNDSHISPLAVCSVIMIQGIPQEKSTRKKNV